MRSIFILLTVVITGLVIFGASLAPNGIANERPTVRENTQISPQPGTRCTRLSYGPRVKAAKKSAKPTPVTGAYPGSRCARLSAPNRKGKILPNTPPTIELFASMDNMILLRGGRGACPIDTGQLLSLKAISFDADGDTRLYTYSVTGGRVSGDGPSATWDLGSAEPGTYTASAEVDDGCGCVAFASTTVTVAACAVR